MKDSSNERPWLDSYPPNWPSETLDTPEVTVPELFLDRTEKFSKNPAVHFQGRTLRYDDLRKKSLRFAQILEDMGVTQREHISLCMPNCPQYTIAFYGAMMIGAVAVPTSFLYTPGEMRYQLRDAEVSMMIILDVYVEKLNEIIDETPVDNVIVTSMSDFVSNDIAEFIPRTNQSLVENRGWNWYHNLVEEYEDTFYPADPQVDSPGDRASIFYTGGTTGDPKGVVYSHRHAVDMAAYSELIDLVAYDEDGNIERGVQTVTGIMPFYHTNGNFSANLTPLYNGASVVLYPRFDPEKVLRDIEIHEITHMHTVPTMLVSMLNHDRITETNFDSLRHLLVGSAPVPSSLREEFEEITQAVTYEGWGQTENLCGTCESPDARRDGSCGLPVPGVEIRVYDNETGTFLPPGQTGELICNVDAAPSTIDGYWKKPEETKKTIRDQWIHTGDLGYMDEDGFFYFVDRKDDMIVTAGHNVYPTEVEDCLYEHPRVIECAVIGLPDEYRGKEVTGYVTCDEIDNEDELKEELDAWCRERLAGFKVPRQFEFMDELPKTSVGKISRKDLQEQVLDERNEAES